MNPALATEDSVETVAAYRHDRGALVRPDLSDARQKRRTRPQWVLRLWILPRRHCPLPTCELLCPGRRQGCLQVCLFTPKVTNESLRIGSLLVHTDVRAELHCIVHVAPVRRRARSGGDLQEVSGRACEELSSPCPALLPLPQVGHQLGNSCEPAFGAGKGSHRIASHRQNTTQK